MSSLISVHELKALLEHGSVKVIDGSWALDGTNMRASYEQSHIPGAVFFDLEAICDQVTTLPHMAPTPKQFEKAVGDMGISEKSHVVIYDQKGLFSAPRIWWTFRLMGHNRVQILSGGLPAWLAAGFEDTAEPSYSQPVTYHAQYNPHLVITMKDLKAFSGIILDARPLARFKGEAPEPRQGLRSGHMPGSRSLPFSELIQNGTLRPKSELESTLAKYGVSTTPIVTTCGSGVTAAILSLALYEAGHTDVKLYDGSWAEWGQDSLTTPVVTGAD